MKRRAENCGVQVVKYFKTKKEFGQYQLSKKLQAHMDDETKTRQTQESDSQNGLGWKRL